MSSIYKAICAIIEDCPAIDKGQKNAQQGFMYRGIDAVMNVFQPLLAKHKVFVVPEVLESHREERQTKSGSNLIYTVLKVRYTFFADDGSSVSAIVQGEGMDSADKSSNKAMSVAFKYACFQVFCIPTEEMKDPDADTPEPSKPKEYKCADCGKPFRDFTDKNGKRWSPEEQFKASQRSNNDGKARCKDCKAKAEKEWLNANSNSK